MAAPDPQLIERFRRDCLTLLGEPLQGRKLALAVSGGPDSMAMLVLADAAFPRQVIAASVDHGLRPAAADEAAMVATYCAELGVPHATLSPPQRIAGASLQARAREARYSLLLEWARAHGAAALLTAHHADDQAETFLMRAARGSGVAGLAAIRPRREPGADGTAPEVPVIRPLLRWRRAVLRLIVARSGAPFADDPTNADEAHDRTRFRQLIETAPWLNADNIARAAEHIGEAEQSLRVLARMLWTQRAERDEHQASLDVAGLPREMRRRLARRAIDEVRRTAAIDEPAWSDAANIEPFLDALEAGHGASQAGVMASAKGATWRFRPSPPRRSH